ncbi:DUF1102 domain-containing protein [Halolamina rubra]|uniref:DUF1102 domain-containing protein n=1 Tax=Halolamina rubra TaxID=1380430 RepID=UPI0012AC08CA|nr:DUF1102 domain-containing protein [Halolamina rubra]
MDRRKFIAGLGSLVAAGAAGIGTGAFESVEAERDVTVEVGGDNSAYLGLEAVRDDIISDDGASGQLTLDLGSQQIDNGTNHEGDGFNADAVTEINGVFRIKNQGTKSVSITIDESALDDGVSFEAQTSNLGVGTGTLVDLTVDTLNESPAGDAGSVTILANAN